MRLSTRPLIFALALALALALAVPLSAASAHPRLVKSSPAADSRSTEAPRQLTLTFNESLDLALTRVTLQHDEMPIQLDSLRLASGDDKTVIAKTIGTLGPGRYTLRWQVSGDDGHPMRGSFSFEILAANAPARPPQR